MLLKKDKKNIEKESDGKKQDEEEEMFIVGLLLV